MACWGQKYRAGKRNQCCNFCAFLLNELLHRFQNLIHWESILHWSSLCLLLHTLLCVSPVQSEKLKASGVFKQPGSYQTFSHVALLWKTHWCLQVVSAPAGTLCKICTKSKHTGNSKCAGCLTLNSVCIGSLFGLCTLTKLKHTEVCQRRDVCGAQLIGLKAGLLCVTLACHGSDAARPLIPQATSF